MMAAKTLEQRLNAALRLDDPPAPAYAAMENRLNEIVELLQKQIDKTRKNAQVALEPGHLVRAGQQFNVVVYIPNQNRFRDTLFRAYIPATGSPVTLDFIGDSPEEVDTPDQMEERVINFLALDQIRSMIRTLRETAAKSSAHKP
jgi:hypothetical protein